MAEIFYNAVLLEISSHPHIQGHRGDGLKLATVGAVFTPQNLVNTTNLDGLFGFVFPAELLDIYQHVTGTKTFVEWTHS